MRLETSKGKIYDIELVKGTMDEVDLKINGKYAICFYPSGNIDYIGHCHISLVGNERDDIKTIGKLI